MVKHKGEVQYIQELNIKYVKLSKWYTGTAGINKIISAWYKHNHFQEEFGILCATTIEILIQTLKK
jgi:hypothetical protein